MKKVFFVFLLLALPWLVAEQAWSCRCVNGVPYRCDAYGNCVVDYDTCGYICVGTDTGGTDTGTDVDTDGPDTGTGGTDTGGTDIDTGGTDIDTGGTGCPPTDVDKQFLLDKYDIWVQGEEVGTQPPQTAGEVVEQKTNCDYLQRVVSEYLNPEAVKKLRNKVLAQKRQEAASGKKVYDTVIPRQPTYFEAMDALAKLMSDCPSKAKIYQAVKKRFPKEAIVVELTFNDDTIVGTPDGQASVAGTQQFVIDGGCVLLPSEGTEEQADKAETASDGQETAKEGSEIGNFAWVDDGNKNNALGNTEKADKDDEEQEITITLDEEIAFVQKTLKEAQENKANASKRLAETEKIYKERDKNFAHDTSTDLHTLIKNYKQSMRDYDQASDSYFMWEQDEKQLTQRLTQLQRAKMAEQGGSGNND